MDVKTAVLVIWHKINLNYMRSSVSLLNEKGIAKVSSGMNSQMTQNHLCRTKHTMGSACQAGGGASLRKRGAHVWSGVRKYALCVPCVRELYFPSFTQRKSAHIGTLENTF